MPRSVRVSLIVVAAEPLARNRIADWRAGKEGIRPAAVRWLAELGQARASAAVQRLVFLPAGFARGWPPRKTSGDMMKFGLETTAAAKIVAAETVGDDRSIKRPTQEDI